MVRRADTEFAHNLEWLRTRLREARTQPNVTLGFKDGRSYDGAITFVERLGTGRLINVDCEFSMDFHIRELRDVAY